MKFLKYIVVIIAYEILSGAISAAFALALSLLGILGPEVDMFVQSQMFMLTKAVAVVLAIVLTAWAATRYDSWHISNSAA